MESLSTHLLFFVSDDLLLLLLLCVAVAIALTDHLFFATILLAIFSLLMAAIYMVLGAPDVAITEAAIGAGVSTLLFLATLLIVDDKSKKSSINYMPLILVACVGVLLFLATLELPTLGDVNALTNQHIAPYYLNQSTADIGIPNVVTSVLASYRGFDTMGEVFVIFTAGIAAFALLFVPATPKKQKRSNARPRKTSS